MTDRTFGRLVTLTFVGAAALGLLDFWWQYAHGNPSALLAWKIAKHLFWLD